jgi:hypothetical protein
MYLTVIKTRGDSFALSSTINSIRYNHATQRNATQRNATQRNATQRNATQRHSSKALIGLACSLLLTAAPLANAATSFDGLITVDRNVYGTNYQLVIQNPPGNDKLGNGTTKLRVGQHVAGRFTFSPKYNGWDSRPANNPFTVKCEGPLVDRGYLNRGEVSLNLTHIDTGWGVPADALGTTTCRYSGYVDVKNYPFATFSRTWQASFVEKIEISW